MNYQTRIAGYQGWEKKRFLLNKKHVSLFFCTVCSDLTFCPHTDDLLDMGQEKRESDNRLFFLIQIV